MTSSSGSHPSGSDPFDRDPHSNDPLDPRPAPPSQPAEMQASASSAEQMPHHAATQAEQPPPSPTGQPGSGPAEAPNGAAWYNGPLPIEALAPPQESIGSAIGRTAIKSLTALVVLGIGLFLIPFLFIVGIIGAAASAGGGEASEDLASPTALVAGEADADVTLVAVPVNGVILGEDQSGGGGFFSPTDVTYGYTIKEELERLAEDDSVDGVILEMSSPGGTIFGSRAIAEGVAAYQEESGKPVIAYVSSISASGGVYSMSGADVIYADHGTLIGSIGVIFGPFTTFDQVTAIDGGLLGGGVTTEGGIQQEFLSAGRNKDFGNPYRPITDEERSVLQGGLDNAYADFVSVVAEGRGIAPETIVDDLGAHIFGEQQAVDNGLIDQVANRDETYQLAAEAAGLEEDETYKVERLQAGVPGFLDLFAGRLLGGDAEPATGIETNVATQQLCLGSGTVLAYHGNPAALCTNGG